MPKNDRELDAEKLAQTFWQEVLTRTERLTRYVLLMGLAATGTLYLRATTLVSDTELIKFYFSEVEFARNGTAWAVLAWFLAAWFNLSFVSGPWSIENPGAAWFQKAVKGRPWLKKTPLVLFELTMVLIILSVLGYLVIALLYPILWGGQLEPIKAFMIGAALRGN